MIKHYDLTESDVSAKPFEAEALYYCYDSKNVYFDSPTKRQRIKMSSDSIIIGTEAERRSILAPIFNKIYIVLNTGCQYIYNGEKWVSLNRVQFEIPNIELTEAMTFFDDRKLTSTIIDDRIISGHTCIFVPDSAISDLIEKSYVNVGDGYAYIEAYITIPPIDHITLTGRLLVDVNTKINKYENLKHFSIILSEELGGETLTFSFIEGMNFDQWAVSEFNNINDVSDVFDGNFYYDGSAIVIDTKGDTYCLLFDNGDIIDDSCVGLTEGMEFKMDIY